MVKLKVNNREVINLNFAAADVAGQVSAVSGREVIAAVASGFSASAQAVPGAASVGALDEKTIMEHMENQKRGEGTDGFEITAPAEP